MKKGKKRLKTNSVSDFKKGDKVIYIPKYLLFGEKNEMIKIENLGLVQSINHKYVFVRYKNEIIPKSTDPVDLYFLHTRPDLENIILTFKEQ